MKIADKEYLPLLKVVAILNEKGIPTTVESVSNGMVRGTIDAKMVDGKWYISKDSMVKRIREQGRKLEPIQAGYHSIHAFIYHLSEHGIDYDEWQISHLISMGEMACIQDSLGRFLIPEQELVKRIQKYGSKN